MKNLAYMIHCIVWCALDPIRRRRRPHTSVPIGLRFPSSRLIREEDRER